MLETHGGKNDYKCILTDFQVISKDMRTVMKYISIVKIIGIIYLYIDYSSIFYIREI